MDREFANSIYQCFYKEVIQITRISENITNLQHRLKPLQERDVFNQAVASELILRMKMQHLLVQAWIETSYNNYDFKIHRAYQNVRGFQS